MADRLKDAARANTERHAPELMTPQEHPRDVAARCVEVENHKRHRDDPDKWYIVVTPPPPNHQRPVLIEFPEWRNGAEMEDERADLIDAIAAIIAADREGRA